MEKILVGNGFPMNLLRRKISIEPVDICEFRKRLKSVGVLSFWGHENTMAIASDFIGADLTPPHDRPAISLDKEGLPVYHGTQFRQCYILSADYVANFRPAIGEEVSAEKIKGWTALKIDWT